MLALPAHALHPPLALAPALIGVPVVQLHAPPQAGACADANAHASPNGTSLEPSCSAASVSLSFVEAEACFDPNPSITMGYLDAVDVNGQATLTWVASAADTVIAYYEVFRSASFNGPFLYHATVPASPLAPTAGAYSENVGTASYWYFVVGHDNAGTAANPSNKAQVAYVSIAYGGGVTISWNPSNPPQATVTYPGWVCNDVVNDMFYFGYGSGYVYVDCLPLAQNSGWVCKNPFAIAGIDSFASDTVTAAFDCATQDGNCTAGMASPCLATVEPYWNAVTPLGSLTCSAYVTYTDLAYLQGWSVTCFNDP